MMKTLIILLIASLTILSIPGCKKSAVAEAKDETPPINTVYIYDNYFVPTSITVTNPNTEITWVNKGSSNHTVTVVLLVQRAISQGCYLKILIPQHYLPT